MAVRLERQGEKWCAVNAEGEKTITLNGKVLKKATLFPGDRLAIDEEVIWIDRGEENGNHIGATQSSAPDASHDFYQKLINLAQEVSQEKELRPLLEKFLTRMAETFQATEAFLFNLAPDGTPKISLAIGEGDVEKIFSDTVVQQVIRDKKAVYTESALSDPRFEDSRSISDLNLHTLVCAPIQKLLIAVFFPTFLIILYRGVNDNGPTVHPCWNHLPPLPPLLLAR